MVPSEGQENGQREEEEEEKEPEAEAPVPPQVSVEVALPPPVEHEVKKGRCSIMSETCGRLNSQSTLFGPLLKRLMFSASCSSILHMSSPSYQAA